MATEKKHHILLIDDDEKLAGLLSAYFKKFDITLSIETTPSAGIQFIQQHPPDLIILDVMLPEMDGFDVCRIIRQKSNIPIIMLSARGDVNDRVVGLATGADDYLSKPFEPRELVARIENILSRISLTNRGEQADILQFPELTINRSSHEVTVCGRTADLTTKEYALLLMMSEHPSTVYSRDDIMNEISGIDSELFSRSVDILVSRLRNKLKPLDCIETVWGIGYKFNVNG